MRNLVCVGAVASALLACSPMSRAASPVAAISETSQSYASIDDAVRDALRDSFALSQTVEYGGAILRCGDEYRYTQPVTENDTHSVRFSVAMSRTCSLAAIYHTHPTLFPSGAKFSPADVATARALRVPSYIGVLRSLGVRVLTARDLPRHASDTADNVSAEGRLVGNL
jgi:hypothetical protein